MISGDMAPGRIRSAGVTAAATLSVSGSVLAFFVWGWLFLPLIDLPPDPNGKYPYQVHPLPFALIALVPPFLVALGLRTGIGLFRLRPWARKAALLWASIALAFCLSMIALRPFETFVIPERAVSDLESLKQLLAASTVLTLLPISIWWLFFFRLKSVLRQFESEERPASSQES